MPLPESRFFTKEAVAGKTVVDSAGKVTGKVKDLVFSLDGTLALVMEKQDGTEIQVPIGSVLGISDFVVVRGEGSAPIIKSTTTSGASMEMMTCKFCGTEMAKGTVACPSCGRYQA